MMIAKQIHRHLFTCSFSIHHHFLPETLAIRQNRCIFVKIFFHKNGDED